MTTAIQTATAVGYFRVSSPGQAGERPVTLEVQEAAFNDYCRSHHLNPVATFTDVISGRKDERSLQGHAITRCRAGHRARGPALS